jgi:hypothetical protein
MSVPSSITLYAKNDQYIEIDGLADGLNPSSYINGATVTLTLKDATGTIVPEVNALVLSYVASTNGVYRGQVANTLNPATLGSGYKFYLDVDNAGVKLHMEISGAVKVRKT